MNEGQRTAAAAVPPVKDGQRAHPVAEVWRPLLHDIVRAIADGDLERVSALPHVEALDAATATQIRAYVAEYGEDLAELPAETWSSSVSQWMGTNYWEVLVDLWTVQSGRSDLVLSLRVFEEPNGYRVKVEGVYVP